jgi:hypothetical protein
MLHEEKTSKKDWANHNVSATGRNTLRFIFRFKCFPAPITDASTADLGKFIFPLQILDGLEQIFLTLS